MAELKFREIRCGKCYGLGTVHAPRKPNKRWTPPVTCPACDGSGTQLEEIIPEIEPSLQGIIDMLSKRQNDSEACGGNYEQAYGRAGGFEECIEILEKIFRPNHPDYDARVAEIAAANGYVKVQNSD